MSALLGGGVYGVAVFSDEYTLAARVDSFAHPAVCAEAPGDVPDDDGGGGGTAGRQWVTRDIDQRTRSSIVQQQWDGNAGGPQQHC